MISQLSIKTESRGNQLATLATKATSGDAAEVLGRPIKYIVIAPWLCGSPVICIVGYFSGMRQNGPPLWCPGNGSKSLWQVTLYSGLSWVVLRCSQVKCG